MLISHSRRLILFANPKTGSRSLRNLLQPLAEEPIHPFRERTREQPFYPHMSPAEVLKTFEIQGRDFWTYRRITSVRNPFSRLVSLYRMIQEVDGLWRLRQKVGLGRPDFSSWLRSTKTSGRGGGGRRHQRWRRYGSWSAENWLHDEESRLLVTDVLRLEDFAEKAPALLHDYDLPPAEPKNLNAREAVDWSSWYSAESRALVRSRYAWDLEHYYPEALADQPLS